MKSRTGGVIGAGLLPAGEQLVGMLEQLRIVGRDREQGVDVARVERIELALHDGLGSGGGFHLDESESTLPSGSLNHAMRAPPGAVQMPRASCGIPG